MRGIYDVAVIDWMLPGRDGPAIIQAMRSAHLQTGILMLTARTQTEDKVAGLSSGADDYLTKPFSYDELIARIYALGRRVHPGNSASTWEIRIGGLVMDLKTRTARRSEKVLDLTKTEWSMLECFMRHPGQTLPREFILDYVWSFQRDVQPTMVDVYISYLRKKLDIQGKRNPIQTKRGVGYYLQSHNA